jgi:hypothetical protein
LAARGACTPAGAAFAARGACTPVGIALALRLARSTSTPAASRSKPNAPVAAEMITIVEPPGRTERCRHKCSDAHAHTQAYMHTRRSVHAHRRTCTCGACAASVMVGKCLCVCVRVCTRHVRASLSKGFPAQGVPEGTQGELKSGVQCGTRGSKRGTPWYSGHSRVLKEAHTRRRNGRHDGGRRERRRWRGWHRRGCHRRCRRGRGRGRRGTCIPEPLDRRNHA